jgi:hypothetical protein
LEKDSAPRPPAVRARRGKTAETEASWGRGRGRRGLRLGFQGGVRWGWREGPLGPSILWLGSGSAVIEPATLALSGSPCERYAKIF